jgi:hypothetical protein
LDVTRFVLAISAVGRDTTDDNDEGKKEN